jgi:hypothetical protein
MIALGTPLLPGALHAPRDGSTAGGFLFLGGVGRPSGHGLSLCFVLSDGRLKLIVVGDRRDLDP